MDNNVVYDNESSRGKSSVVDWKSKMFNLITKKNLKILFLIVIGLLCLFILFGFFDSGKKSDVVTESSSSTYLSTLDYCREIELKLQSLIENIDGAGDVSVMVSVDGSPEIVYASDKSETNSSNISGAITSTNSSNPIIVQVGGQSSALILTEKLPKVKGVIVVSGGAGNVAVKLNILNAVSTLLGISNDQVCVLKGI